MGRTVGSWLLACGVLAVGASPIANAQQPQRLERAASEPLDVPVFDGTIVGRFVDASGAPLGGGEVLLPDDRGEDLSATAAVGADGAFRCEGVGGEVRSVWLWRDGRLRVHVLAPVAASGTTDLGDLRVPAIDRDSAPLTEVRGRILDDAGAPVPGVRVDAGGGGHPQLPTAGTVTAADGAFVLHVDKLERLVVTIRVGGRIAVLQHRPGAKLTFGTEGRIGSVDGTQPIELRLRGRWREVVAGAPAELRIDVHRCPQPGTAVFATDDLLPGWLPLSLHLPGRLPQVVTLQAGDALPVALAATAPFALQVVDAAGRGVAAQVAVAVRSTGVVAACATDAAGRLARLGGIDMDYTVRVRAPGCAPVVASWRAGGELRVELPFASASLRVGAVGTEEVALVYARGALEPLVVFRGSAAHDIQVAPGAYDIVVSTRDGAVLRATTATATATAATVTEVDPGRDRRATVRVQLPVASGTANWRLSVRSATDELPRVLGAVARELAIEPIADGEHAFVVRLPRSGRYTLVAQAGRDRRYEFVLDAVTGRDQTVELPPLTGRVVGPAVPIAQRPGDSLWLLPRTRSGWATVVAELEVGPDGAFAVDEVPIGDVAALASRGAGPFALVPLAVRAGDDAILRLPAVAGELHVRVLDAAGKPAQGTLRARDRCREAHALREARAPFSSLAPVSPTLREPPRAELRDGTCTLPAIGKGLLDVEFTAADGDGYRGFVAVDPEHELLLQLPAR